MKHLIDYKKGENSLINYIKRRISIENGNFLIQINSKNYLEKPKIALNLAKKIDEDFLEKNIVFSFKDLLKLSTDEEFLKKKNKVIIFEEIKLKKMTESLLSKEDKLMIYFLSTFRHLNICLIFINKNKHFRKLVHMDLNFVKADLKKDLVLIAPVFLEWRYISDIPKIKKLIVLDGINTRELDFMYLQYSNKEIFNNYLQNKNAHLIKLKNKVDEELKFIELNTHIIDNRKDLTDTQREVFTMYANGMNQTSISKKLNCSIANVSKHIGIVKKKGYKKEDFLI